MADWTELDTNGLLPGEPLTSAKALAFFENPVAMAEGAVNAPRNVLKSIERIAAGAFTRATRSDSFNQSQVRVILELGLLQIGTVRVAFTSSQSASKTIVRRRAGSNTTLVSGTGSLSVDASVIPGDLITCTGTAANIPVNTSFTATFSTNGENLWPAGGNGGVVVNNDV